jgi:hypothetical protein
MHVFQELRTLATATFYQQSKELSSDLEMFPILLETINTSRILSYLEAHIVVSYHLIPRN